MKLDAHGIAVELPGGWEGRVWRRPQGGPVVHAANFPLPAADGDFGTGAAQRMPAGGVLVVLVEYEPELADTPLFAAQGPPAKLRAGDLSPKTLLRTLPGQAGVQRFFTDHDRPFCLYVVIGSAAHAAALTREANEILAGLTIS